MKFFRQTDLHRWLDEEIMRRHSTGEPWLYPDTRWQLLREFHDRKDDWWIEDARQRSNPRALVYFAQEEHGNAIKIGTSVDVSKRIQSLQCVLPYPLKLLATTKGGHEVEALLHARFAAFRIRNEWFKPDQELLKYIERGRFSE